MKELAAKTELVAKKDLFGLSEADVGALVNAAAYGKPFRDLAVAQVKNIIDQMAHGWFGGENLRREMYLEVARLTALGSRYFIEALEGSMNASLLYLKICERKSILTGMTPQQGHAITIINQASAPQRPTTTAEITSIIDEIRALPKQ